VPADEALELAETPPLDWTVLADTVSRAGCARQYEASPAECEAVARFLGITAVNRLALTCRLSRRDSDRILMRGTLKAEAVQACVVTCDPVVTDIDDEVEVEFWPEADSASEGAEPEIDVSIEDAEPPSVIQNGRVELGALTVELLGIRLDPYPRAPGAEFDASAGMTHSRTGASGPFAALASLKKSPD
jgi:hypothetical protein